jgi:hypothetical protein
MSAGWIHFMLHNPGWLENYPLMIRKISRDLNKINLDKISIDTMN